MPGIRVIELGEKDRWSLTIRIEERPMAFKGSRIMVSPGPEPTILTPGAAVSVTAAVKTASLQHFGDQPIYLGGPDVTADSGVRWDPQIPLDVDMSTGTDVLYGIVADGVIPQEIHSLEGGV